MTVDKVFYLAINQPELTIKLRTTSLGYPHRLSDQIQKGCLRGHISLGLNYLGFAKLQKKYLKVFESIWSIWKRETQKTVALRQNKVQTLFFNGDTKKKWRGRRVVKDIFYQRKKS